MVTRTAEPATLPTTNHVEQSNLLADRIERFFIRAKAYWTWILAVAVIAITVLVIVAMVSSASDRKEAQAWGQIYFAQNDASQLESIAESYGGTRASTWAALRAGDATLARALTQVYTDRTLAMQLCEEARTWYEQVLAEARGEQAILRANFGIAQTFETEGKLDEAVARYQKILQLPGGTIYEPIIAERLTFLTSDEGKAFVDWFQSREITPPRPTGAADDLLTLPGADDLQFSPSDQLSLPPAPTPPAGETTPSADDSAPAGGAAPPTSEATEPAAETAPAPAAATDTASPTGEAPAASAEKAAEEEATVDEIPTDGESTSPDRS